jgi:hypothetical protein
MLSVCYKLQQQQQQQQQQINAVHVNSTNNGELGRSKREI